MKVIVVNVPVHSVQDALPDQKLQGGEHIVRRVLPLDTLNQELKGQWTAQNLQVHINDTIFVSLHRAGFRRRRSTLSLCDWMGVVECVTKITRFVANGCPSSYVVHITLLCLLLGPKG